MAPRRGQRHFSNYKSLCGSGDGKPSRGFPGLSGRHVPTFLGHWLKEPHWIDARRTREFRRLRGRLGASEGRKRGASAVEAKRSWPSDETTLCAICGSGFLPPQFDNWFCATQAIVVATNGILLPHYLAAPRRRPQGLQSAYKPAPASHRSDGCNHIESGFDALKPIPRDRRGVVLCPHSSR